MPSATEQVRITDRLCRNEAATLKTIASKGGAFARPASGPRVVRDAKGGTATHPLPPIRSSSGLLAAVVGCGERCLRGVYESVRCGRPAGRIA